MTSWLSDRDPVLPGYHEGLLVGFLVGVVGSLLTVLLILW